MSTGCCNTFLILIFFSVINLAIVSNVGNFNYQCSENEVVSGLSYRARSPDGTYEIRIFCRSLINQADPPLNGSEVNCRDMTPFQFKPGILVNEDDTEKNCVQNEYVAGISVSNTLDGGTMLQLKCCNSDNFKQEQICYKMGPVDIVAKPIKALESPSLSNFQCPKDALNMVLFTDKGLSLKFCTMVNTGQMYPDNCKAEHGLKTAAFQDTSNVSQTPVLEMSLSRLKIGEDSVQGTSFNFECPREQAIHRCFVKLVIDEEINDIIFRFTCQKVLTQSSSTQQAIRKRTTRFSSTDSTSSSSAQCSGEEFLCGVMSNFENGKRIYALHCCDLSNTKLQNSDSIEIRKLSDKFTSRVEHNETTSECMKIIVIDQTYQGVLVKATYASYQYISRPKFIQSQFIDENKPKNSQ